MAIRLKGGYTGLLLALLLTAIAIAAHPYLPARQLDLLASPERTTYLYYDQVEGGGTQGAWLNDSGLAFRCSRYDPAKPSTYCGMSLELLPQADDPAHGLNLAAYDSLYLDIDVKSTQPRLSIILRNFDPRYAKPGDINSAQHIVVTLRRGDLQRPIQVNFSEFAVSEWWLVNRDMPRPLTLPSFDNIILLGVDLRNNLGPGSHEVVVNEIVALGEWVSAERWYLGILLLWMLGLTAYGVTRSFHWKHQAHGKQVQFNVLANKHRELREHARELKQLSERDSLTGLLNRMGLELAFERMDKTPDNQIALLLLDIDYFKTINDHYGHVEGDRVIFEVSQLLQDSVRATDVLARWGGEEFLLICPHANLEQAFSLSEKIRMRVHNRLWFADSKTQISVSVGVVSMRRDETFPQVFARADTCLYRAKNLGRNRTVTEREL
ncbi:diguanylate cyclase [Gilvimarinus sp. DA14]|uniref:GGDEF domain-containing protein n=1 Tax=Gilvimarinus sp. DA14 TaxID=2956798 RepID=UPI0020B75FB8|nr:GGDEF domain-containing protein [Gilvimarinus sp. DA14]UTF59078.1 GGDEF domain-containing protein [Gilvimarinus sp. DA14]